MIAAENPAAGAGVLAAGLAAAGLARLGLWLAGRGRAGGARRAGWAERAAHAAALVFAALAAADPVWTGGKPEVAVMILWDRSESVTGADSADGGKGLTAAEEADWRMIRELSGRLPEGTRVGLADFAGEPRVLRGFERGAFGAETERLAAGSRPGGTERTDIERALALAGALRPECAELMVILISDGWQTGAGERDLARAAGRLGGRGARLWAMPSAGPGRPEVIARELAAPARIFEGERARLRLRVWSSGAAVGRARLFCNDLLVAERRVELGAGENEVRFEEAAVPPGLAVWTAEMAAEAGADTRMDNNRAVTGTKTRPAARVLLVDPAPETLGPMARLLRGAGFEAETGGVERLPRTAEDLAGFEAVVVSDCPVEPLEGAVAETLREWVSGAGGLLVVCGGAEAFAAGGYAGSQFEELLPVRSGRPDRVDQAVVAVLVSLDRSGSMQATAGGRPKMELANRGAVMAMEVLGRRDLFGVHAVDTRAHEILPLGAGFDRGAARARIMGITPGGGGIYVYTALAEAARELETARARARHVILFADAADAEEKTAGSEPDGTAGGGSALDFAAGLAERRITVSVVALGTAEDRDAGFLAELAARGGGKFYLTANALDLPRIFAAETARIARRDFTEEPFLAVRGGSGEELARGVSWEGAPFLYGANLVEARPGAETPLLTEAGTPLLAVRRLGLGRVVVFASDIKGRWGAEWLEWPGFAVFWNRLLRGLLPGETPGWFELRGEGEGRVVLRALDAAGRFLNGLAVRFVAHAARGGTFELEASQTGPGTYEGALPRGRIGAGEVVSVTAVAPQGGRALASVVLAGSGVTEHGQGGVNEEVLRRLAEAAGGRFCGRMGPGEDLPGEIREGLRAGGGEGRCERLAPWLLAVALGAMLVKLAARRLAAAD